METRNTAKSNVRKNDQVIVTAGKELGKKGKVLKVYPKKQQVIVEGLNFIKKAQRPSQRSQKGGIIEMEAPIHISNVLVICSRCSQPTRIGRSQLQDGKRIRVCKKCGELLDK
jgi:large subunit ribosomal protein L24